MNIAEIGKLIGEEIAKKPEICWYPGGFKPPHKGHLAATQQLASKPYITQVKVLIGHGERGGITAKQSKAIWDIYLKAQPNPKIVTEISQTKSPIRDLYRWFGDDLSREAYVAAAGKEADDLKYFEGLKEAFGDRVQEEIVDDQFVDSDGDRVSGTDFRATIAELRQRYLQVKNNPGDKKALNDYNTTYNYFKSLFPEAVIQKGHLDDIQRVLGINFPEPASLQEGSQPNPKNQPQWVWLEYKNQNKLNPLIFGVDETVDPEVRELLLKVANYFWEGLEIPEPFEDVLLTGSSVNYNYTPTSDIDLHIVVDFDKFDNPELLKKYFDEAKLNWNRVHDLKLGKQNIEVYIQDNEDHPEYRGEYSLMNDKWLRRPSYVNIDIPDEEIEKKTKLFKQQIDKLEKTGKDNPEKAIELTNKIKERLKNFRQAGLDKDGEYSLENLAFKDLRNTGYLEKLSNLKNSFIDKTLSLVESVDKDSLFEKFMAYACNELQIQNPPTFEVRYEYGEDQPSFGAYVPSQHHISVNPSNRNIVDVLRTLAHELVHAKQNEMGILQPDSGETGSEHENDANAIAGILMRDYGKQNPNIYNIGMLNESINKTAGVWDTNEKFKDGSDFKIKFKVSDIIDLAKNTPVKEINPKDIKYNFSGRQDSNPEKTKERVMKADLSYPIIAVKNEKGKIFAMLDGTHRLEKALNLGLDKIKTKILNKEDLIQFKTDKLNESRNGWYNFLKKKLPKVPEYVLKDWIYTKINDYKDYQSFINWLDEWNIVGLEWEYKKDFPMTMDIFSEKTQKELKERINGLIKSTVDRDEERHKNQKELLKSRGISKEPITLFKYKDGKYDLGEGWHRTVQNFKMYPEGYIQPNVYIGLNAKWLNESKQSNFNIKDIAQEFMSSKSYNKSDDCKISTYKFVNWLKTNKNINPDVLLLAPPKDIKKYPGKNKEGDSHIFTIINGNGIDFTANQFPGVSEPLKITPEAQIPSEYKRIGGYYTSTPDYFKNKTFIKDKFNNLPQWFHDSLKSSLNEAKQSNFNNSPKFQGNSNPLKLKYIDTWHDGQDLAFKNKTKEAIKVMTQAAKEAKEFAKADDNDLAEFKYYLSTIDWLKGNYKTAEKYINDKEVINSRNDEVLKRLLQNKDKSYEEAYGADLKEAKQSNPPITRIYFDLDGVLAGFDEQFTKYNDEGLEFKEYIGKYGSSKAWDIINKGKVKFWSEMPWNPGGQQLYNKVMELAKAKNFEVWILSSPGLDPNGDAKKGKNIWVDKHLNIPLNHRVYKQAKEKHTEAKPGYMLIDDMGSNVSQFIEAGGTGIKNNPKDSTESIKKLYKFKYE